MISPKPDLGPEDRNLKSLRIFNNEIAKVFNEFEKLTKHLQRVTKQKRFVQGNEEVRNLMVVEELLEFYDDTDAVSCVQHDYTPNTMTKMDGLQQTTYPRKNWSSLMMYLDMGFIVDNKNGIFYIFMQLS